MNRLVPPLTPNARWELDLEMKQKKYISTRYSKKVDMHTFVDSVADELVYCNINVIMKKNWPRKLCKTLTNFIWLQALMGFSREKMAIWISQAL